MVLVFMTNTNEIFKNLYILKIYDLFTLFMSLYCFKIFNGLKRQDIMIKIIYMQTNHNHNLRNNNLTLPGVNIYKFNKVSYTKLFILEITHIMILKKIFVSFKI